MYYLHGSLDEDPTTVKEEALAGLDVDTLHDAVVAGDAAARVVDEEVVKRDPIGWTKAVDRRRRRSEGPEEPPAESLPGRVLDRLSWIKRAVGAYSWWAITGLVVALWWVIRTALRVVTAPIWYPIALLLPEPRGSEEDDRNVPWKVRFLEEIKHLTLDIQSGWRKSELALKFLLPAGITFFGILIPLGIWVAPHVLLLLVSISLLMGAATFGVSKRRLQRRLDYHRSEAEIDYWNDVAGEFKTVHTEDVTAYMGFIGGRRYAAYDREEFVQKTAKVMWQRANGYHVHPATLEHNARLLAQYKPNLQGYYEQFEKPEVMGSVLDAVQSQESKVTTKAKLAWDVCEPRGRFYERHLGHDPELVAEEYEWMVRCRILGEQYHEIESTNGETLEVTLVFPASKTRLPEADVIHSLFNDRFLTEWGGAVYPLPDVDPNKEIKGYVPSDRAAAFARSGSLNERSPVDEATATESAAE